VRTKSEKQKKIAEAPCAQMARATSTRSDSDGQSEKEREAERRASRRLHRQPYQCSRMRKPHERWKGKKYRNKERRTGGGISGKRKTGKNLPKRKGTAKQLLEGKPTEKKRVHYRTKLEKINKTAQKG